MGFDIISGPGPNKMYKGQIIEYVVRPAFNIPVRWVTEITHVEDPDYFVDEQRFGPYRLWHHKHFFKAVPGGTEMTDLVHYVIPFGILGKLAHILFIKKRLDEIFNYREAVIKDLFSS